MKKWLFRILFLLLGAIGVVLFWAWRNGRDRFPGYAVDLNVQPLALPGYLRVGFSAKRITPAIPDQWQDMNQNSQFDPENGDTWQDGNGNQQFDAYWLAGFQNRRPAQKVHDDIWARAVVFDDGSRRVAIVSLDLIGFGHDNVIRVRQRLSSALGITYIMVGSTHVHAAPDMLGIWGADDYTSGLNPAYSDYVIQQAAAAITEACGLLRPANLIVGEDSKGAAHLVGDTRKPYISDQTLHCIRVVDHVVDTTLGTIVVWGNHPETTWADNLSLTSDFPHYVRQALEKGIYRGDSLVCKGLGGTAVYMSGAIGGLMTTHPDLPVRDTFSGQVYLKPDFEKARAQGEQLAVLAINALQQGETLYNPNLGIHAKTFEIPLGNNLFRLAVAMDMFNRGYTRFGYLRSEAALVTLGNISFLAVPGEIYPEIIHGGIENPAGADFQIAPVETPPLLTGMPGKHRIVLGLMNDELGYIIPRSEWDNQAPWLYGAPEQLYGEINSCGPETAPIVHQTLLNLCKQAPQ